MITKSFRADFKIYNQFEEIVYKDKANLVNYIDFDDSQNQMVGKVKKKEVYNSTKEFKYLYAVEYTNSWGRFELQKGRQFANYETIKINDKAYNTAKFNDNYLIKSLDQNDKYAYIQITYYAKGIGMVKYERFAPTGEIRILELEAILSIEEFNELKKKK